MDQRPVWLVGAGGRESAQETPVCSPSPRSGANTPFLEPLNCTPACTALSTELMQDNDLPRSGQFALVDVDSVPLTNLSTCQAAPALVPSRLSDLSHLALMTLSSGTQDPGAGLRWCESATVSSPDVQSLSGRSTGIKTEMLLHCVFPPPAGSSSTGVSRDRQTPRRVHSQARTLRT